MRKKLYLIYLFFLFLFLKDIYGDNWLHLYFYEYNQQMYHDFEQKKFFKYYNLIYNNEKKYNTDSKESSIFFLFYEDKVIKEEEIDLSEGNNIFQEYKEILENLPFDYINLYETFQIYENEKKILKKIINKNNKRILCFKCDEKNHDIFLRFEILKIQNLKLLISYIKKCENSEESIKKLLNLHQDTNIWIFILNDRDCIQKEIFQDNYMIFMVKNKESQKGKFYKFKNRYICSTSKNFLMKLSLKIRESTVLSVESKLIKIF